MADEDLKWFLFTPACFESVTKTDINGFISSGCPAAVLSKVLGYSIIAGAALLKVPQVLKLISSQSGKGLSIFSLAVETLGFATTTAYFYRNEYALSTYGEAPLIFFQNLILLFLIFQFEKQFTIVNIIGLLLALAYISGGISGVLPMIVIDTVFSSQFLITLGSRVPQIVANFQNKSTGALAMITVFMQFLGCIARLFTTMQEIDDIIPLLQYLLSTLLNGILFAQFFIYPSTTDATAKTSNGNKTNGKKSESGQKEDQSKKEESESPRKRKRRKKD